jgi:hypothetical protein
MIDDLFLFSEKILSESEIDVIKNYILKNENNIKQLGPDNYPGTSEDSLTGRHAFFNYLHTQDIGEGILLPKLKKIIKQLNLEPPIIIQCWANIFRNGEGISIHRHGNMRQKFLSGNLFICGNTLPGTTYYKGDFSTSTSVDIENEPGVLNIFPSYNMHGVKENLTEETRISMAIDIIPYSDTNHFKKLDMIYKKSPRRYIKLYSLD